ncbi:MAG TPA: two-component sensor histidine kinase, partial [Alcanivorax sp.]|nr:two-component sensor histidine kinase [Alcanivorax sp.]
MPNFLPKSSFARSALIIGLVIGLSQGITLWFFARNAYLPGIREYARLTALQAELVFQSEGDASLSRRLGETTGINAGTPPELRRPESLILSRPVVERFRDEVSELLGEAATVRLEDERQPVLWVTAPSFGDRW